MKKVISRRYFKNRLWKVTESIQPAFNNKPSKELQAFNYIKCYEKREEGNGYKFIRLTRQVWNESAV